MRLFVATLVLTVASCGDRSPSATSPKPRTVKQVMLTPSEHGRLLNHSVGPLSGRTRISIMTDKPIYQPGETVKLRVDARHSGGRRAVGVGDVQFSFFNPRRIRIATETEPIRAGVAEASFTIAKDAPGGTYEISVGTQGSIAAREITVGHYRADSLKKSLEFTKRGYVSGDRVEAAVSFHRATGEALSNAKLSVQMFFGDTAGDIIEAKTDEAGKALVAATLPRSLVDRPVLAVTAHDGGAVETIVRPVPTATGGVRVEVFPEGGVAVAGIPTRVFVKTTDQFGDPIDVRGRLVDIDSDKTLAEFDSVRDGYGRVDFFPRAASKYAIVVDQPRAAQAPIPIATNGCALQALDEIGVGGPEIRVRIECTDTATLDVVAAGVDGRPVQAGVVRVPAREPIDVTIPGVDALEGLARISLLRESKLVAATVIFRANNRRMKVKVTPAESKVAPRSKVRIDLQTTSSDQPTAASLGVAVVDDAVLAMAGDKQRDIFAQIWLSELNLEHIPDPSYYLSEKKGARDALFALVGAEGWQPVDWQWQTVGAIYGIVQDEIGNPIPGVTVVATGPALKGQRSAITDASGRYVLPKVPSGAYELTFLYGVREVRRPTIPVATDHAARLDIVWKLVDGETIAIRGTPQAIIDTDFTQAIPVPGRTFESALEAAAGSHDDGIGISFSGSTSLEGSYIIDSTFEPPPSESVRTRFVETVFWQAELHTDKDGRATITAELGDSITSYRVIAQGFSSRGLMGRGEATFAAVKPLSIAATVPTDARVGDVIDMAITVTNRSGLPQKAVVVSRTKGLTNLGGGRHTVDLAPEGQKTVSLRTRADMMGRASVEVSVRAGSLRDDERREFEIAGSGYPRSASLGGVLDNKPLDLALAGARPNSARATMTIYPSLIAQMTEGTDSILRDPSGCFEQTSSANYPNVMALQLLQAAGKDDAALTAKVMPLLERGYKRLIGYESKGGGFEWFGGNPAHEALTAYGLLQFRDMAQVYGGVDRSMIERTAAWLISRRDGKGGFENGDSGHPLGRADKTVSDPYIVWALAESGYGSAIKSELETAISSGLQSGDPYIIALATLAAVVAKDKRTTRLATRLASLQSADGSVSGAKTSITDSRGRGLTEETTALAAYALLRAGREVESSLKAIRWLDGKRVGGRWLTTQGTVLALKAIALHGQKAQTGGGEVKVTVAGKAHSLSWTAGQTKPVVLELDGLVPGDNAIEVASSRPIPFSIASTYWSRSPAAGSKAPLAVATKLGKRRLRVGETTNLRATVRNLADKHQPMTLVRVGIPTGMRLEPKQLAVLREKRVVDFIETRPSEVTLYFRGIGAKAQRVVDLVLVAESAGDVSSPPTSAGLYYTPDAVAWAPSLTATIRR